MSGRASPHKAYLRAREARGSIWGKSHYFSRPPPPGGPPMRPRTHPVNEKVPGSLWREILSVR